jgi:hypothetical protein
MASDPATPVAQAVFYCSVCNQPAGSVEILRPRHRLALGKLGSAHTIFIRGFIGEERVAMGATRVEPVKAALEQADPAALYAIEKLWAPFYCKECSRVYCREHWSIIPLYDGDFFDCSYGYCPEGHKRLIED